MAKQHLDEQGLRIVKEEIDKQLDKKADTLDLTNHIANKIFHVNNTEREYWNAKADINDIPTELPASDVADWAKADNKPNYTADEVGAVSIDLVGVNSGVASLDENGKVPSSQLPSYVDDVIEYTTKNIFPLIGEAGKIYIDTTTNLTYRWTGTTYIEISPSIALGETSSTAYAGDKGKTLATNLSSHTSNKSNPHGVTKAQVGLGNVDNTSDANKPISTATQTALDLKANKSDIPTSLPANGGNADTVDGIHIECSDVAQAGDWLAAFDEYEMIRAISPARVIVGAANNANTVNNHTVDIDVPANAKFTDTKSTIDVLSADPASPAVGYMWITT